MKLSRLLWERSVFSAAVLALLVWTSAAIAQVNTSVIAGQVTDESGLAIPGATVNVVLEAHCDDERLRRICSAPIGARA